MNAIETFSVKKPTFNEALKFWIKLGWISFGGPAGQIAIMHEFLVEKKRWISDKKFLHALNYCMLLPGPEAQQLATYIGWLLHGKKGGLTAGIFFILPSIFILLALSILYVTVGNIPWVAAMFDGLKPAVVAIVIMALIKISKKSLQSLFHVLIAALSFVFIFFFNIPFPLIILSALVIGFISTSPVIRKKIGIKVSENKNVTKKNDDESGFYLTTKDIAKSKFSSSNFILIISSFVLLWLIPLLLYYFYSSDFYFWKQLTFFFTQAAFITFGGAYAVLPYVAQQAVEHYHWLSNFQMIDGLALGETTPGPLIMVLTFVGFMGAYHHFESSILAGSLGLITTTYVTFLPCFLFIFAGAPLIEHTQQNKRISLVLNFVTAAVVGVILNLTIYFAEGVVLGKNITSFSELYSLKINVISLGWIAISFFAMYKFKIDMMVWIGISALYGLATYFF